MHARDELLRATVYRAIDLRCDVGSDGWAAYTAAVDEVVFVHRRWPLIEYAHAIECARRTDELVQLLRDTYVEDLEREPEVDERADDPVPGECIDVEVALADQERACAA
jgi:hypothetical protein